MSERDGMQWGERMNRSCLESRHGKAGRHGIRDAATGNQPAEFGLSGALKRGPLRRRHGVAVEDQAFEDFRTQGDRRLEGAARVYLSYILLDLAELERAQNELVLALETAQPPMRPQILASLAREGGPVWSASGAMADDGSSRGGS